MIGNRYINLFDLFSRNIIEEEKKEEKEDEQKKIHREQLYELEEFFLHKTKPCKRITFAKGKLAHLVYYNTNFYNTDYDFNENEEKKVENEEKN